MSDMSTPSVATLVHRLAGCPDDFLAPPLIGDRGVVAVAAVLGDTLASLGAALPDDWLAVLTPGQTDAATENWLRACLVSCWLASDESARSLLSGAAFLGLLGEELWAMAALVRAELLVRDPDRREELARLVFRRAGWCPPAKPLNKRLTGCPPWTRRRGRAWRPRPEPPKRGPRKCAPPWPASVPRKPRPEHRGNSPCHDSRPWDPASFPSRNAIRSFLPPGGKPLMRCSKRPTHRCGTITAATA
ncbi:hypothetical protein I547_1187 [Mycobacterium kansasii 824]|nr:hypothetical protein I547_1187 [Mycobacterium kansasii 824]